MKQTANKSRLGRGLEALLGPASIQEAANKGSLVHVAIDKIRPNRFQPRNVMDETALTELQSSLQTSGLLQPVVVRRLGADSFELIAGERRWRAAEAIGWKEIGAVIRDVDDKTMLTLALVENLQRDSLSPIDEALGYERMMNEFGSSQAEVAELVGKDRSTVANSLRLLRLPESIQDLVDTKRISPGHARALLQVGDESEMLRLAGDAVAFNYSVRDVEDLGRRNDRKPTKRARRGSRNVDPEVRRIEETLRKYLKTDVMVAPRSKGSGRIWMNYYSNDDLARLLELVLGRPYDG